MLPLLLYIFEMFSNKTLFKKAHRDLLTFITSLYLIMYLQYLIIKRKLIYKQELLRSRRKSKVDATLMLRVAHAMRVPAIHIPRCGSWPALGFYNLRRDKAV